MAKILENDLLYLGFKRKQKNKQKFLFHPDYNITLSKIEDGEYVDVDTEKKYTDYSVIASYIAFKKLEENAVHFKSGLSLRNLSQGDFKIAYKESETKEANFIDNDTCKKLLESKFNELITSSLMLSNGEPTYNYSIKEAKYYFRDRILTLSYYYESKSKDHSFHQTFDIFEFEYKSDKFCIGRRQDICVPISFLIENFI